MSNLSLFQELEQLLRPHSQYTSEDGVMLKNSIVEAALKLRPDLLKLILSNEKLKANFFTDVEGMLVFDKVRFQKFVMNKRFLPDSYTSFKNKIGLTTDEGDFMAESREVVLSWPYKDCVLEGGQTKEEAKRNEVFWNEILAPDEINRLTEPKVLTNFKKFDADGEHKVESISKADNLIIKGNNLLALHSLKKTYAGQVKLIYIDPPYNTGSDSFKYNDAFNHSSWLTFMKNRLEIAWKLLKEDGVIFVQCDDNEHAYLKALMDNIFGIENFEITIYVQVRFGQKTLNEDNDYQKLIEHIYIYKKNQYKPNKDIVPYSLDKFCWNIIEKSNGTRIKLGGKDVIIFKGDEYDIIQVEPSFKALKETWATGSLVNQGGSAAEFFDLYLEERKPIDGLNILYKVLDMGTKGDGLGYRYITGPKKETSNKGKFYSGFPLKKSDDIDSGIMDKKIPINNFLSEEDLYKDNFLDMKEAFGNCRSQGNVTFNSGKKPEQLLKRIIEISTKPSDIILDYHLGSGTTAAVAHKMGRKYIGIEQMNYGENDSVVRLQNVIGRKSKNGMFDVLEFDQIGISKEVNWQGGGSFVYCELAKANQGFADQILASESKEELAEIWQQMQETGFLSWKVNLKQIDENAEDFASLSVEDTQKFLLEALDKNLLYIPYSEIDNQEFAVTDDDKRLNAQFYGKA